MNPKQYKILRTFKKIKEVQQMSKSLNKKFTLASMTLLTLSVFGTSGLSVVSAATTPNKATTDQISDGNVAIYAEQAAPTGGYGSGQTNTFGNNDGSDQTSGHTTSAVGDGQTSSAKTGVNGSVSTAANGSVYGMSNVTFDVYSITSSTGKASDMTPANVTYNDDGTPNVSADGTNITLGDLTKTGTTDGSGLATISGLSDGYYLITQVTTVGGVRTVAPFIIQVNTEDNSAGTLNVYPKLSLSSSNTASDSVLVKGDTSDTVTDPNAISNSKLGSDDVAYTKQDVNGNTNTAGSNDTVTWNVNSTFDQSQVTNTTTTTNAGKYVITDTIPTSQFATGAQTVSKVNVTDSTGKVLGTLTAGTDYTVSTDGTTVTLTPAGQIKAADLIAGGDGTGTKYGTTGGINVQYTTTVSNTAVGQFKDSPSTTIVNAYGTDLSTNVTTGITPSTLNVGGTDFEKEATGSQTLLQGAEFVLVQAKTATDAQDLVKANASLFNNTAQAGSAFKDATSTNAKFVTDSTGNAVTTTTDSHGVGSFTGLNLVDTDTDTSDATTYFAVEVKAPGTADGNANNYALPNASNAENVFAVKTSTTTLNGSGTTNSNIIYNNKPFALPFTGGEGLTGIIIIATVAGLAAFAIRRRRDNEEEQA